MPIVEKSSHLGIIRSTRKMKTDSLAIEQNITKARRISYSLMNVGLHSNNGLDPVTSGSIIKWYILPVLTYGIDILQPSKTNMNKLEKFQKSLLKKVLSLPPNAPDPALYIITGFMEAQIDLKCLTLFSNICRQNQKSLEKSIAIRQLQVKDENSNSWFMLLKRTPMKYGLINPLELFENSPSKIEW